MRTWLYGTAMYSQSDSFHSGAILGLQSRFEEKFARSQFDIPLRDGDELFVPKKANFVMVAGQVFNPTAVGYLPNRSAKWYLTQAGGFTQIADKNAVFVIRADGSVISAKSNSDLWAGNPMSAVLRP